MEKPRGMKADALFAMGFSREKKMKHKNNKNRQTKRFIVFDDQARMDYLTGFRKRKNERRKKAEEEKAERLKEEKREFKKKRKEMLIKSQNYTGRKRRKLPELEDVTHVEPVVHDLPNHTVTITDISDVDLVGQNGIRLGQNMFNDEENNGNSNDEDESSQINNRSQSTEKQCTKILKRKQTDHSGVQRKKTKRQNFSHSQDIKFKRKRKSKLNPKERKKIKKKH